MRIQHNIMAMNAYRNYTNNTSALAKNLEKLSSGYRINRAGDDAAGLAISEKMRAQITALGTAQKNVKDGISLVKTAEGATQEIHDMLNRMVDLATQSANGTYQDEVDRDAIQEEFNALKTEINRIADSSNFNGIKLLDGTLGLNTKAFDVGSTVAGVAATAGDPITLTVNAHGTAGQEEVAPGFSISLGGLEVSAASAGNLTINIGSDEVSISLATKANGNYTAADIAQAIITKYGAGTKATNSASIGGLYFKAEADGANGVKFTYVGNGTNTGAITKGTLAAASVTAINAVMAGATVTASGSAGKTAIEADFADHAITKPTLAVEESAGGRAGADITITASLVANGNQLKIGDSTYTFITEGTAQAGANDIDLRGVDAADLVKTAINKLANANNADFVMEAKDATTLHVDVKAATANMAKYPDADSVEAAISANEAGTPAKGAGTVLDINAGEVKAGNVLTIGTKAIKFTGSETTASAVKAKIEAEGFTVEAATGTLANGAAAGFTRYIVRNTDAAATTGPQILGKGLTLQIGEDSQDYNQLSVAISDMHCESLGLTDAVTLNTQDGAQAAVDVIKNAINSVSSTRGKLGATQNRLEHTANNLSTMKENIQDAEATIRDTDIAEEMMAYTKNNILVQSAQAMLAQANQIPQGVLQLLG